MFGKLSVGMLVSVLCGLVLSVGAGAVSTAALSAKPLPLNNDIAPLPKDAAQVVSGMTASKTMAAPTASALVPGEGFTPFDPTMADGPNYTLRLLSGSWNVDALRNVVQASVNDVQQTSGVTILVAPGTIPDTVPDREPAAGEILLSVDETAPCGEGKAGCGGPRTLKSENGRAIVTAGRIWIHPVVLSYSITNQVHVVEHELGHALGLAHYEAQYNGQIQIMHPSSYDAPAYRSGDRNGLLYLSLPPTPPTVKGLGINDITLNSATIYGSFDPKGLPANFKFECGVGTAGYSFSTTERNLAPGSYEPVTVGAVINNLTPNTNYHCRLTVNTAGGIRTGADETFSTLIPPALSYTPPEAPSSLLLSNNEVDVFGRSLGVGDQLDFVRATSGAWSLANLTSQSAFHPKMGASTAVIQMKSGELHAFAPNQSGEMIEFAKAAGGGAWFSQNLSAAIPGTPKLTATAPSVMEMSSGQLSVFARTTGNELISFERAPSGAWTMINETVATSGHPHITSSPAALPVEPSLYFGTNTIVFASNESNELISFDRSTSGAWVTNNMSKSVPGLPLIAGAPAPIKVDPNLYFNTGLIVFARNQNNELISFDRYMSGSWVTNNMSKSVPGLPHILSTPAPIRVDPNLYFNTGVIVFGRNENNELISFDRYMSGSWVTNNMSKSVPGLPHILGSPAVIKTDPAVFTTGLTVFARNSGNELISFDRFMSGSWVTNNMSRSVPGLPLIE